MVPLCPSSPRADPSCYSWWPFHRTWGLSASKSKQSITLSLQNSFCPLPQPSQPLALLLQHLSPSSCRDRRWPRELPQELPTVTSHFWNESESKLQPVRHMVWANVLLFFLPQLSDSFSKYHSPNCSCMGQPRPLKLQRLRTHLTCIETQSIFKQSSSYIHSINWILNNIKNTV